jgi:hypothetical protein
MNARFRVLFLVGCAGVIWMAAAIVHAGIITVGNPSCEDPPLTDPPYIQVGDEHSSLGRPSGVSLE